MLPAEHVRLTALAVDHGRGTFNRYNLARLTGAAIFPCLLIPLYLLEISNLWLIAAITVIVPIVGYAFYWKTSDTRSLRGSAVPAPLQLIREGRADGLAVLSGDLFDRLGLLLILWMVSLEDQGHYLTAVPAASMLLVAPHAFALFSFKLAADHQQPLRVSNGLRLGALVIAVQALSWLALSYVLQPLLLLLYGEPFRAALPVTGILLSAMAINGCGIVGDGYLRGRGRASVGVWTRIAGALVMLVAVWYYHAWPPLLRVAMATTVGTAAIALITGWVIIRDLIAREKSVAA
jgi:O-antigen/teichoic acid export membrane protein